MRALVYHGPGRRAWEDVPQPGLVDATSARKAVVTPRAPDQQRNLTDWNA